MAVKLWQFQVPAPEEHHGAVGQFNTKGYNQQQKELSVNAKLISVSMYLNESGGEYDQEDLGGNFNRLKYQINIFCSKK